jgi:hypothetical protein
MRRAGQSTAILLLGGVGLFVDLFLRWGPGGGNFPGRITGWEIQISNQAGPLVIALVLVELARFAGVWRSPASALLGFFLGAGVGVLVISALIHLRWGAYTGLRFGSFGYGAWIGLAAAVVVLAGAWLRLVELRPQVRRWEHGGPAA